MTQKEIIELLNDASRKISQYEYAEEMWEFLCDPQTIAQFESLSEEDVESIWDEIAESFMSTPAWCTEARAMHTLSVGDRALTFTQMTRRLAGRHKEIFDVCFLAKCSMVDFQKYYPLSQLDRS